MPEMPSGWNDFNPNNPFTQLALLAQRVDNLGKEKEEIERSLLIERTERAEHEAALERRLAKIENSFQRGAGILMVLPVIGTVVGLLIAYGKAIFAPWTGAR
jgi:uncharacterized protein YheU (UPF0270 family)